MLFEGEKLNKTAVFESRIDVRYLAYVADILRYRFGVMPNSMSQLIRMALQTLCEVGEINGWLDYQMGDMKEKEEIKQAYHKLVIEHGIWAYNKGRKVSKAIISDPRYAKVDNRITMTSEELEKTAKQIEQEQIKQEKNDPLQDLDMVAEKMINALIERGDLVDPDDQTKPDESDK